jgi:2-polyprenyl-6-methoxyphenol hydroxylase-like FAD-dependent oxidoreductase
MMLGYLLARAGIQVLVLEKHADFLRDFRGDTIHPSTLEAMHELDLLDKFPKRPHQKQVRQIRARIGRDEILLGDFSLLSTHCRFMVMMPQWEFLDFLAEQARSYPTFHLRMATEIRDRIDQRQERAATEIRNLPERDIRHAIGAWIDFESVRELPQ